MSRRISGTTHRSDASASEHHPLIADGEPAGERLIRVLIVEDHRMFSQALKAALDEADDIAVTAAVETAAAGVAAARETDPDVVLMDYRLPDGDGVDAARRIKAEHPDTKIVMLTATSDDSVLRKAIAAGCSGYLTKNQTVDELMLAVRAAHSGEALISPAMLSRLLDRLGDRSRPGSDLTSREAEVLRLLAQGLSNPAIASTLGIRMATVRNHVQSVIEKLHAHSKLEAVAAAIRLGVIRTPE
jgi:DNA-binding NarL/FixJ family response regulator